MRIITYISIFLFSCTSNCTEYAICNDDRLEFGIKCDLCKDVGIKFYFDCKGRIVNC